MSRLCHQALPGTTSAGCLHKLALDSSYEGTCPSLDGLDGLRIVYTGCVRKKGHVNLYIQKANSALMGSVFHPH
jgi:hypothetical protein